MEDNKVVILIYEDTIQARKAWLNDANKITYINIVDKDKRAEIVKAIDELS